MSSPTVIRWLPGSSNTEAIATSANNLLGANVAGNLVLNSSVPGFSQGSFIYDKVIRNISLASAQNLSGRSFTISGIGSPVDGDGNPTQVLAPIIETPITGPNTNTVYSANVYSQINSISYTSNATPGSIKVGFGNFGITDYVFLDYNRIMFATSLQVQFITVNTSTVSVYQSLNKPQSPNIQYGNLDNFQPIPAFNVASFDEVAIKTFGYLTSPASIVWATISSTTVSPTPPTSSEIYFTVLQQGIR